METLLPAAPSEEKADFEQWEGELEEPAAIGEKLAEVAFGEDLFVDVPAGDREELPEIVATQEKKFWSDRGGDANLEEG